MTINILHLYYDLMNLYGEIGNIMALKRSLEDQKVKVIIDNLTKGDDIDFNKYDLIYIGSGTKNNQCIVLKDIIKYEKELKKYIESNKFIIATGNSYELFLNNIDDNRALGIFDYNCVKQDKRIVGDVVATCNFINDKVIGFLNQESIIIDNNNPMFKVLNNTLKDNEGIQYNNFYGTYLLGPILVRNPNLLKYIVTKLIKSKNKNYKLKSFDLKLDKEAYKIYMNMYHNED